MGFYIGESTSVENCHFLSFPLGAERGGDNRTVVFLCLKRNVIGVILSSPER